MKVYDLLGWVELQGEYCFLVWDNESEEYHEIDKMDAYDREITYMYAEGNRLIIEVENDE